MTKSDYIKIAAIMKDHIKRFSNPEQAFFDVGVENAETVSNFCEMFKQDNPNFNQDKFIQAVYEDK